MVELLRSGRTPQLLCHGPKNLVQIAADGPVCLPEVVVNTDFPCAKMPRGGNALFVNHLAEPRHTRRDAVPDGPVLLLLHTTEITEHRRDMIDRVVIVE